jgi:competence protein ComEC
MHTGPITRIPSRSGLRTAPLFHAAWLFACGIVVARWVWLRPGMVLIAAALAAALCCVAALAALRIAWLPLAVLWVLLGAWCGLMQPQPAPSPTLAAVSDDLLRTVEGTVVATEPVRTETEQNVDAPAAESASQRIDVQVASVEQVTDTYDGQAPVAGRVRLTVRWPSTGKAAPQAFRCGERIRAVARLLPPETYHDPGVWSRAGYLLDQGITATANIAVDRIGVLNASPERLAGCRLAEWQHDTAARLLALPDAMRRLPPALRLMPDDAAMLAAMVAGDRTYLAQSLRVGFERTGSFHMLVVSGLHLAIVAGCLFWILRKVRLARGPATFATIAGSFAYALFTGFATPVQRSLWMITLYLLARLVYRERNTLNTIGFAALCLLAVSPRSLFDAGLQMTLLAVIAIGGVAAPLLAATVQPYVRATRELRIVAIDTGLPPRLAQFRVTMRMFAARLQAAANPFVAWRGLPWTVSCLLRIVELVAVSCVVELAMTLPMAVYFHRITLFALPVNLLILPLLALLLPAALLMLLVLLVWPAAAVVPAVAVALLLHLGAGLVRVFGALALANLRVATPLLWQTALFCALLAAAIVLAHSGRWQRRTAWAALLLAALGAVVPRPVEHPAHALLVETIDVGQGDSILLITPNGKTLLVDGGGFAGGPRQLPQEFDIGEEVVSPSLWARGIQHLDAVALTHAHSDHMGGLPAVLRNFHPKQLWVGNNPPVPNYKALLAEAARLHVQVRSFHAGEGFSWGGIRVNVLAPLKGYQPGLEPSNDDSLVLHVAYGASSVLLEGDAEAPVERAMLSEPGLASSLLKVGHHGSITSTRPEFLARVDPRWAVISCGLHNRYGHPRQEVLDELEAAHVRTLRTDIGGMACFVLNGTSAAPDFRCGWRWGP